MEAAIPAAITTLISAIALAALAIALTAAIAFSVFREINN
jgi:hypothetical protein